jgi:hypothetical protein
MKQRFLNQKLGKRISRKMELHKAKAFASKPNAPRRSGHGPGAPEKTR